MLFRSNVNTAGTIEFNQATNSIFTNDINGAGTVVKSGAGVLTLNNAALNTGFTGNVNVTAGTLQLDSAAQLNAGLVTVQSGGTLDVGGTLVSPVNVNIGGILKGSGAITGTLNLDGSFNPGNSPGTFTVNGNLNLSGSSILNYEQIGRAHV